MFYDYYDGTDMVMFIDNRVANLMEGYCDCYK